MNGYKNFIELQIAAKEVNGKKLTVLQCKHNYKLKHEEADDTYALAVNNNCRWETIGSVGEIDSEITVEELDSNLALREENRLLRGFLSELERLESVRGREDLDTAHHADRLSALWKRITQYLRS